jgi:hypothetical protein
MLISFINKLLSPDPINVSFQFFALFPAAVLLFLRVRHNRLQSRELQAIRNAMLQRSKLLGIVTSQSVMGIAKKNSLNLRNCKLKDSPPIQVTSTEHSPLKKFSSLF